MRAAQRSEDAVRGGRRVRSGRPPTGTAPQVLEGPVLLRVPYLRHLICTMSCLLHHMLVGPCVILVEDSPVFGYASCKQYGQIVCYCYGRRRSLLLLPSLQYPSFAGLDREQG